MKLLLSMRTAILFIVFYNVIVFPSDKHVGIIDAFVLKSLSVKKCTTHLNTYFTLYSKPESHFPKKEPLFITIDGALHPIDLPTHIKPFIVTIHNAENIINANPDIFCIEKIKNKIAFESQNQSNNVVHTKLADRIIPIDHCTYIKPNGNSIDIISLFFGRQRLHAFGIQEFTTDTPKTTLANKKKERVCEFLDVPSNNHFPTTEFKYSETNDDQDIVHRANLLYYGADLEDSDINNPDIICVSNDDFYKESSSD